MDAPTASHPDPAGAVGPFGPFGLREGWRDPSRPLPGWWAALARLLQAGLVLSALSALALVGGDLQQLAAIDRVVADPSRFDAEPVDGTVLGLIATVLVALTVLTETPPCLPGTRHWIPRAPKS